MMFFLLVIFMVALGFFAQWYLDKRDVSRRVKKQMEEIDELLQEYKRKLRGI